MLVASSQHAPDGDEIGEQPEERACRDASFKRNPAPRMYHDTILICLLPSEDEIFAGFRSTARKNIRAMLKTPATVRQVTVSPFRACPSSAV